MSVNQVWVPVGEFRIATDINDMPIQLATAVGSCVAVVLYDMEKHIGGLLHVVLPGKRLSIRKNDLNSYYVDTGIPLLIEEMINEGASIININATIAGGAKLFSGGPEKDIGNKNVEAVKTHLEIAGIKVNDLDVRGNFAREIKLDINTGKVSLRKIQKYASKRKFKEMRSLSDVNLKNISKKISAFPPDSQASSALLDVAHNPYVSVDKFQNIILKDIVLAGHIYRMCNSPYYGMPGKISSIHQAIEYLGKRKFSRICIVATMMKHSHASSKKTLQIKDIRIHSLSTAVIARHLAVRYSPEFTDDAGTAGILHCIGKLGFTIATVNHYEFGGDYSQLGSRILGEWNIPDRIVKAVTMHQNPRDNFSGKPDLIDLIHLSCMICNLLGISFDISYNLEISQNVLSRFGISGLEPLLPGIFEELRSVKLL